MLLSKNRMEDYTSLKGLQIITSLDKHELPLMPPKEILDDAADEAERKTDPTIKVTTREDKIVVEDNGNGIPRSSLNLIFDWDLAAYTKFVYKPSRGCFGYGLKVVAVYLSSLSREYLGKAGDEYLRIRSRDYDFLISNVRYSDGRVKNDRSINDAPLRQGTLIEVKFPVPILSTLSISNFLANYVLINPWISFEINGVTYARVSRYNVNKRAYAHYYTFDEFAEFITRAREQHPKALLKEIISDFAFTTLPKEFSSAKLEGLSFDDISSIYKYMRNSEGDSFIGYIGKRPIARRFLQIFGNYEKLKYSHGRHYLSTYEIWCFHSHDIPNAFVTGINNTLPYRSPLEHFYLYITEKENSKIRLKGLTLNEILKRCGINNDEPVLTLFHIFTPKPKYGSYVKASIGLSREECEIIGDLIYKTCRWYSGHKGYENASLVKCDRERLLSTLMKIVSNYYSKGYRLTLRHVFYKAAPYGLYPFNKRGYRIVCETLLEVLYKRACELDPEKIEILTVDAPQDGIYVLNRLKEEKPHEFENALKLLQSTGGSCNAGDRIANIDPFGNIYVCQFAQLPELRVGNIRQRNFSDLWNDNANPILSLFRNKTKNLMGKCGKCPYKQLCGGGCRIRAYFHYNNLWLDDPLCSLTMKREPDYDSRAGFGVA